jgi:TatD DNase family protein
LGLIDSHAHLDFEDYASDLDGVVSRARAAGLEGIVCIGLWRGPGRFGNALELASRDPSSI